MKKYLLAIAALIVMGAAFAATPKDTYVYLQSAVIDSLDPVQAYDGASIGILENVYETLYSFKKDSLGEYEPTLATSYEVSKDGMTYTFHLRKGVKFHSGNPMTCKDVKYSIQRNLVVMPGDSGAWIFGSVLTGYGDDAMTEAKRALGDNASKAEIDKFLDQYWKKIEAAVTCDDMYTVSFHLAKPDVSFMARLLFTGGSVVDSKFAVAHGEWSGTEADWKDWIGRDLRTSYLHKHDAGTGPYKLVKWDGNNVVAEAFDGYWGGAPAIKKVLVQSVEEEATRLEALRRGDADRVDVNSWATVNAKVKQMPGVKVWSDPKWSPAGAHVIFFNFNVQGENNPYIGSGKLDGNGIPRDFFSDINLRKAFAYCLDQDAIYNDLFEGHGSWYTMALPPTWPGYNPDVPIRKLDLDKAEEYFKKAWGGKVWEKGFKLTITYNAGNTERQTVAEMIKANVESINPKFKIDIAPLQWSDYLKAARAKSLPIWPLGWGADYADSDNFIHPFYHSRGSLAKRQNFKDPEFDKLIDYARTLVKPEQQAERYAIYKKIGRMAYDVLPNIPYPLQSPFIVTRDNLQGVYYNSMISRDYYWKDISKK